MLQSIHELIRDAEDGYLNGSTKLSEHVDWSMKDTIDTIDAYVNSRHISGPTDAMGREKPFFNIVTAAVNIWYRATDIDRKNIRILPDKISSTGTAFIATVLLNRWMKKSRFGVFLNEWGRTLAKYGSAVVKFVEKDGELIAQVVPWNRFIADPVQFDAIPRIEKLYMTPAQLRKNPLYDQSTVDELLASIQSRETLDGEKKDNKDDFIELYEVHGELDTRLLQDEPDTGIPDKDIKYRQQMHVVSYVQGKDGEYNDFTLYRGKESKDPYMLTHLIPEDGRTLSIGAVEHLFEAQWMTNHSVKSMKDTLDIASKLIFQTADSNITGRNVLSAMQTGEIILHADGKPLERLANDKPDITAMMNFRSMWEQLGQGLTATPDAMRGETPPSSTPYSTTALITQQSNSLFEIMTENKGLAIEDMLREYIIPHLKKQMDTKEEITAILEAEHISELDAMYIPAEAARRYNKRAKQMLIDGTVPAPYNPQEAEGAVRRELDMQGNRRSFKPDEIDQATWEEALKDLEWEVNVEVTNENTDKQAVLQTLSAVLQTVASNPLILQDPNARMVFNAILTETGRLSPLQLTTTSAQTVPQPTPTVGGTGEALQGLTPQTNVAA